MSKKQRLMMDLITILEDYIKSGDDENLIVYLASNSNLPGPRGNLELAQAFHEAAKRLFENESAKLWTLCNRLGSLPPVEAPTNNPKEFLVFCGTVCLGNFTSPSPFHATSISRLKELAEDPRWRVREAVAMAIQNLIEQEPEQTLIELTSWSKNDNWLVLRAVAAGVAEPALLKREEVAKTALELHKNIFDRILKSEERRSQEFKTLKEGLSYSLSVVIRATPTEGFALVKHLIETDDKDVLAIVRANMKKNRLTRNFPEEVSATLMILDQIKYTASKKT